MEYKNILLIKMSSLGDILHTLPFAAALRQRFPKAKITWLVHPQFAGFVPDPPVIDEIIYFDKVKFNKMNLLAKLAYFLEMRRLLHSKKFDLVIDMQGLFKSAVLAAISGCSDRIGYCEMREGSWLVSKAICGSHSNDHVIERYLDVARYLGASAEQIVFPLPDLSKETVSVQEKLQKNELQGEYIVVVPGARGKTKEWPAEHYASLIKMIIADGCSVVLAGGPDDTAKGEKRTSYSNPADCYECSTYNLGRQKYDRHCTCHHISTKALKSIILKTIQETCHYVSLNEREFVYSLQEESAMKDIAVSETVKNRIERNQKRVHELDMLIRKIYEDNVIGRLPDRLFQSMLTDYENEQNELNKIIETDTADMQRIIGGQNNVERFLKLVKKYENITELTPAMINEFIDKILVHEPQGKGADRTTEVEIYLNYVGQFQVPVEQHEPTEEERIAAEKEAERLRRKRESNRKYMKKIREKSKEFAEHERIAEEKSSDSNVCVEQNVTSKSNRQKVKGEKIA